jgi:hypothetical protein
MRSIGNFLPSKSVGRVWQLSQSFRNDWCAHPTCLSDPLLPLNHDQVDTSEVERLEDVEDVENLSDVVRACPNLRRIFLGACEGIDCYLTAGMDECANLEEVEMESCHMTMLPRLPTTLVSLRIACCPYFRDMLDLKSMTSLRHLSIVEQPLLTREACPVPPSVESLCLVDSLSGEDACEIARGLPNLLRFECTWADDDDLAKLTATSIEDLSVEGSFTDKGIVCIGKMQSLTRLTLKGEWDVSEAMVGVCSGLSVLRLDCAQEWPTLTALPASVRVEYV